MKKTTFFAMFAVLAAVGSTVRADESFDPAASAKMIAPFVQEETAGIIHVNLERIDADELAQSLAGLVPGTPPDFLIDKKHKNILLALEEAGAKDVFGVLNLCDFKPANMAYFLIPVRRGADVTKLLKLIPHSSSLTRPEGDYVAVGCPAAVNRLKKLESEVRPELEKAFEAAGDTDVQLLVLPPKHTARTVEEIMPELPKQVGGGSSTVLTRGLLWAAAGVNLPPKMAGRVVIQSADAESAQALLAKVDSVLELMKKDNEMRPVVFGVELGIKALSPRVEGDQIVFALDEAKAAWMTQLLAPPVAAARESSRRMQSMNHLKQLALAMHNWHDAHKTFPAAAICDKDGKPLLSWRVQLLPSLEQGKLFKEFHLDEPWNSEHNKKLIARMPAVFRNPTSKAGPGMTTYLAPVGAGTLFEGDKGRSIKDITDGTSNTIMLVEANDDQAVEWTKPEDWRYDPERPLAGLGEAHPGGFNTVFCDGSVHFIVASFSPEVFKALLSIAGGEAVGNL